MRVRLSTILLLLLFSCETNTTKWQTLDFGVFHLKTPKGWKIFKEQGIDNYVGGLTNGKDSMWFDYGWYSSEIDDDEASTHLYGQDTINGLVGMIQIPKVDGHGSIRLSIPHINDKDKFNLGGYNIQGTETILKIFKSVIFKESDTTINSNLTIAKFKSFPFGSGRTLYYSNCAGCHHAERSYIGPPLKEVFQQRDEKWVYTFLTNRKSVLVDSLYKARLKEAADLKCMEFPDLTKNDIEQIISYIK